MVTVYTVGSHRIKGIRHTDDTAEQRDLLALQSVRITFSVVSLMMISGAVSNVLHQGKIFQDLCATDHVGFHLYIFFVCKASHLIQYAVRHTDLADIVQLCCLSETGEHLFPLPPFEAVHLLRDHHRILRYTLGMLMCTHVLGIDCICDRGYCLVCHIQFDLLLVQLSLHYQPGKPDQDQG